MLRAVADIGSNTVKYGVYEYCGDGRLPQRKAFGSKTLKLSGRLADGILPEADIAELSALLSVYKAEAEKAGTVSFDIFATAWIRAAKNSDDILAALEKAVGTPVVMLSGDEEARFSNMALYAEAKPDGDGVCADMGGGSTEIVRFSGPGVVAQKSLPFGVVVLKNKFVAGDFPSDEEAVNITEFVESRLADLGFDICTQTFCIVGGTAKALLKLNRVLFGEDFSPSSFGKLFEHLMKNTDVIKTLVPERLDTALPGLIAFKAICDRVSPENVIIVSSGTREGFIMNKYRTKV